jgi:hypothetical protein
VQTVAVLCADMRVCVLVSLLRVHGPVLRIMLAIDPGGDEHALFYGLASTHIFKQNATKRRF